MSESKLNIGDVVRLKSGGQPMTVDSIDSADVCCVWYNMDTKDVVHRTFGTDVLERCEGLNDALMRRYYGAVRNSGENG